MKREVRARAPAPVVAWLPGVERSPVEEALGGAIDWCDGMGEFLRRVGEGPASVLLLATGPGPVDPHLVQRVAGAIGEGSLFLVSADRSVDAVLTAERAGAAGLLPDPPDPDTLRREVAPILQEPLAVPLAPTSAEREGEADREPVLGSDPDLIEVFRVVARVASSRAPVLVAGESGTGKELVARALHEQGARPEGPFVAVNCAAIPEALLEAELFGHERGAFTGAVVRSEGRFGRADGGTLFLDEIGDLGAGLQAKLLRVLETGELERLGSREAVRVDVRIVAATHRDLRRGVREGSFREDLLFRLAVVEVSLPPLRARQRADVELLAHHFARRYSERYGRPIRGFSAMALQRLRGHTWPGNVRELRNVLDRAVLLARGGVIRSADLHLGEEAPRSSPLLERPEEGYSPELSLQEVEARHIRRVLRHTGGHMGEAARILGIHRNTMTAKVRAYGIDVELKRAGAGGGGEPGGRAG